MNALILGVTAGALLLSPPMPPDEGSAAPIAAPAAQAESDAPPPPPLLPEQEPEPEPAPAPVAQPLPELDPEPAPLALSEFEKAKLRHAGSEPQKADRGAYKWLGVVFTGIGGALSIGGSVAQGLVISERRQCTADFSCRQARDFDDVASDTTVLAQALWSVALPSLGVGGFMWGAARSTTRRKRRWMIGLGSGLAVAGLASFITLRVRNVNGTNKPDCPIADHVECNYRSIARTESARYLSMFALQAGMFMIPFGARMQILDERGALRSRARLGFQGGRHRAGLELSGEF